MKGFLLGSALTLSLCASGTALFRQQATALLIGDAPVVANVGINGACNASICIPGLKSSILKGVSIDTPDGRDAIRFETSRSDMLVDCGSHACSRILLHR